MKKIFTLLLSIGSFTAVFAQRGHDNRDNDRYNQYNHEVAMNDHGTNRGDNAYSYPSSHGMNDRDRQQEIDRTNRDYDRRINDYHNDRSLSPYERNRRIAQAGRERKEKTGSFVKGAVIGGIAGAVLGMVLSH